MKQMKKEQVTLLLTGALSFMLLAGCGENVTVEKVDEDSVEVTTDTLLSESEAEASEVVLETETEAVEGDWLSQHNVTITPQGPFSYKAYEYDGETGATIGDFDVSAYADVSEYTDGVAEGYKQVVISYTLDLSANTGGRTKYFTMAFDRYTGIAFTDEAGVAYTNYIGDKTTSEGTILITVDDKTYDVKTESHSENQYPMIYRATVITCPVDYDGVVFGIGYANPEMQEEYLQMDFSEKLYTMDEFPFYENEYPIYYFTATDKQQK